MYNRPDTKLRALFSPPFTPKKGSLLVNWKCPGQTLCFLPQGEEVVPETPCEILYQGMLYSLPQYMVRRRLGQGCPSLL